jgi:hypothetical protein
VLDPRRVFVVAAGVGKHELHSLNTGKLKMSTEPKTLFEKVWQQHIVVEPKGEPTLLYVDLQLLQGSPP